MWRQENGVFIPPGFQINHPTLFAIDKIDLKVDKPDGKNQLHDAAIAVYQQQIGNNDTNMVRQTDIKLIRYQTNLNLGQSNMWFS